ncbi:TetR family transcriptional regulator C-terminal domain-containing protein [Granulicella mallensis]|uniref:Transcriptional regulator, TetR family n=1 Tax=Granulicella mallensis (strain ATCC BAA-1857 / DSM 23137 / MP5ACTX8) TaxID=682795 RepID=G8P027_GRAMM|nr:TetR family transcriptional regulator C-terminal domain-containing protein [Granulicella mallensis]AEU35743.1 transcriptional regulator, TetR family [Granulicella mallensis MP5ACTX8]
MAQKTREQLIEVGLKQIHTAGYGATGVNEILALADVPKGSFYHHFPSKEAFAAAVLQRYGEGETHRWETMLGDKNQAPLKRLRLYFEDLISVYGQTGPISGCLMGNLTLEIAAHSDVLQPMLKGCFGAWEDAVAEALREAVAVGELDPSVKPRELASFIVNNWEGALLRSKAERSDRALDVFLDFTFKVLLKG